jgi:hypothetical protein
MLGFLKLCLLLRFVHPKRLMHFSCSPYLIENIKSVLHKINIKRHASLILKFNGGYVMSKIRFGVWHCTKIIMY